MALTKIVIQLLAPLLRTIFDQFVVRKPTQCFLSILSFVHCLAHNELVDSVPFIKKLSHTRIIVVREEIIR